MTADPPKVVSILKRNADGILDEIDSVYLEKDEIVQQLITPKGIIVVVGNLLPQDEDILRKLYESLP